MARLPRLCISNVPLHVIQRGNNRQVCFASSEDFSAYASWLGEAAEKYQIKIHAWVFMTNHVHLLLTPSTNDGVPKMMQMLGRHYVRYFNYTYKRSGTLWEGRYKSSVVDAERYLLTCQRYIELNPVRAGMVASPADYYWSSYQANALGKSIKLWTPHHVYMALAENEIQRQRIYRDLFKAHVDTDDLKLIRDATNKGMAIGNGRFKFEIEQLSGRRVTQLKRGPRTESA